MKIDINKFADELRQMRDARRKEAADLERWNVSPWSPPPQLAFLKREVKLLQEIITAMANSAVEEDPVQATWTKGRES